MFFALHTLALALLTAGPEGNVLITETTVDAPVAEVWKAFTTRDGIMAWMVPHADIDLKVGGRMLTHYDAKGKLGDPNTIENTILSYDPQRMLSIKATKPPANFPLKEAIKNMWSVVYFEEVGPMQTRVRVVGLGYGDDADAQTLRKHFEAGNAYTLKKLKDHFAKNSAKKNGK